MDFGGAERDTGSDKDKNCNFAQCRGRNGCHRQAFLEFIISLSEGKVKFWVKEKRTVVSGTSIVLIVVALVMALGLLVSAPHLG